MVASSIPSVAGPEAGRSVRRECAALFDTAVIQGVPKGIAREAREATVRAILRTPDGDDGETPRRCRSYFWAVVRRASFRSRSGESHRFRRRLVVLTVVEDLLGAGIDPGRVIDEATSLYGGLGREVALERIGDGSRLAS